MNIILIGVSRVTVAAIITVADLINIFSHHKEDERIISHRGITMHREVR